MSALGSGTRIAGVEVARCFWGDKRASSDVRVQICGYQTTDGTVVGRPISVCSPNRSGVDLTAADARALAADLLPLPTRSTQPNEHPRESRADNTAKPVTLVFPGPRGDVQLRLDRQSTLEWLRCAD
jgi:hypothetical protein